MRPCDLQMLCSSPLLEVELKSAPRVSEAIFSHHNVFPPKVSMVQSGVEISKNQFEAVARLFRDELLKVVEEIEPLLKRLATVRPISCE